MIEFLSFFIFKADRIEHLNEFENKYYLMDENFIYFHFYWQNRMLGGTKIVDHYINWYIWYIIDTIYLMSKTWFYEQCLQCHGIFILFVAFGERKRFHLQSYWIMLLFKPCWLQKNIDYICSFKWFVKKVHFGNFWFHGPEGYIWVPDSGVQSWIFSITHVK